MSGRPVRIEFRTTVPDGAGGEAHAATFMRQRRMVIEAALMADPNEFARIFVHELFHFAWLRLGNARRRSYERLVAGEIRRGAKGELGWSAERRKKKLASRDRVQRTRKWREYCCESFCDTAAWLYAGIPPHEEFTLARPARDARRKWFTNAGVDGGVAI
ncbi:MAG TPA: hypothetical protein VJN43_24115 [Bryobacteraceae bacterium]|nr:hypothetical protein [Bryobacteraceae bacterium]